jgi:hypothetical protein
MRITDRLLSLARGMLWLVRAPGLRGRISLLEQQVQQLIASLEATMATFREQLVRMDADLQWARSRLADTGRPLPTADLRNFEARVYSQNGEDGILTEIFRRIGVSNRFFVEFGAETGQQCNCARLALQAGWQGLFLEADPRFFAALEQRYAKRSGVRCVRAMVTSKNIEQLLATHNVPAKFDLLSIDIDGNDYWVWASIRRWQPRVVVIEYNSGKGPEERWVMEEEPAYRWNGTTYFGASLASLTALARQKGYTLVATNSTGVNAFFVRDDLVNAGRFLDPVLHYYYSPPTHGEYPGGHPPGSGPYVAI